jgi:hypothetical protein
VCYVLCVFDIWFSIISGTGQQSMQSLSEENDAVKARTTSLEEVFFSFLFS